ncbi:MAG: Arc family DNA-binding protein [Armatimonadia bacterium]
MKADAQVKVRLPKELRDWVREKAEKDHRSQTYVLTRLVEEAKNREQASA